MEPIGELGKGLLILGALLAAVGAFLLLGAKLPLRIGRLPGDITYHGRHTTVYFPIITCIILTVVVTLLLWIVAQFRR